MSRIGGSTGPSVRIQDSLAVSTTAVTTTQQPKSRRVHRNKNLDQLFNDENDHDMLASAIRKKIGTSNTPTTRENIRLINALRKDIMRLTKQGEDVAHEEEMLALLEENLQMIGTYKFHVSSTYLG